MPEVTILKKRDFPFDFGDNLIYLDFDESIDTNTRIDIRYVTVDSISRGGIINGKFRIQNCFSRETQMVEAIDILNSVLTHGLKFAMDSIENRFSELNDTLPF